MKDSTIEITSPLLPRPPNRYAEFAIQTLVSAGTRVLLFDEEPNPCREVIPFYNLDADPGAPPKIERVPLREVDCIITFNQSDINSGQYRYFIAKHRPQPK